MIAPTSSSFRAGHRPASGLFDELIIDNFAGGGGASTGIERAAGRACDFAINHDRHAIEMHALNHPATHHLCEDVWEVDPAKICAGRPVGLAWFSPDCKHFSKAKGGRPVSPRVRGLAWVVVRWARAVRPRVIILENVEEFVTWGPLTADGRPCPERKGETFRQWLGELRMLGYQVEHRELRAADYGAPTIRKRLFLVARCDGRPICWPQPTHAPRHRASALGRKPWVPASTIIDWDEPCPSIFDRVRPLAERTLQRIAAGIRRYVIDSPEPFIVQVQNASNAFGCRDLNQPFPTITAHPRGGGHALVTPFTVGAGGPIGSARPRSMGEPLKSVLGESHLQIAAAFLAKLRGTCRDGQPLTEPAPTITAGGNHIAEVRAFLVKYYGTSRDGQSMREPLHAVTTKDRHGLVMVAGEPHVISDIGMRMLTPRELARAQGFPDTYILPGPKARQVAAVGNSVCPVMAEVLVRANYIECESEAMAS